MVAEVLTAKPTTLQMARAARSAGDHRRAVRSYEVFLEGNRGHQEFAAALFETAQSYEALGDSSRALQLYQLVVAQGGAWSGRARKRMDRIRSQRGKSYQKSNARPADPAGAATSSDQ